MLLKNRLKCSTKVITQPNLCSKKVQEIKLAFITNICKVCTFHCVDLCETLRYQSLNKSFSLSLTYTYTHILH